MYRDITGQVYKSRKAYRQHSFDERALHEAGHAVAAIALGNRHVVIKLTLWNNLAYEGLATPSSVLSPAYESMITLAGPVTTCIADNPNADTKQVKRLLHTHPEGFAGDFEYLYEQGLKGWNRYLFLSPTLGIVRTAWPYIKRIQSKLAAQYYDGCTDASMRVVSDKKCFLRCVASR